MWWSVPNGWREGDKMDQPRCVESALWQGCRSPPGLFWNKVNNWQKQSCGSEVCKEDYLVSSHSHWPAKLRSLPPTQRQDKCNALSLWPSQANHLKAGWTLKLKGSLFSLLLCLSIAVVLLFMSVCKCAIRDTRANSLKHYLKNYKTRQTVKTRRMNHLPPANSTLRWFSSKWMQMKLPY